MAQLLEPFQEPERGEIGKQLFTTMKLALDGKEKEKEKKDGQPSMWNYDRRCQPKEFVGLEPETFLEDSNHRLCFLGSDLLEKICEKLPPSDFLNLSLTCRYLHWRMFTLCTCHAPCTVQMEIASDRMVDGLREYHNLPKLLYRVQGEQRGLFVCQPPCLKKPFLFETLEMTLNKIDYKRDDFDRCLPFILAVQKYAKRLLVIMDTEIFREAPSSISDIDDFFEKVKPAVFMDRWRDAPISRYYAYLWYTFPSMRTLDNAWVPDEMRILDYDGSPILAPWDSCPNRFGVYQQPTNALVKQTIQEFLHSAKKLEFHVYYYKDGLHSFSFLHNVYILSSFSNQLECDFVPAYTIIVIRRGGSIG